VPDVSDFSGPVNWFKPTSATAKYYGIGFSIQPTLTGSRYFTPTNEMGRVLNVTNGLFAFGGGNLGEDFQNAVTLSALGTVTNLSTTNKLTVSIQKSSGLLTGSVNGPGSPRSTAFRGVVHQKSRIASGFFLGTNETGNLDYVAYAPFTCRVRAERTLQRLTKLSGSQRYVGLIFPGDAIRNVFLGTLVLGDERRAMQYGQDESRDVAGYVERIGTNRWRLLMPEPRFESKIDVMELVPQS